MKRACTKEQIDLRKKEIVNVVNEMFDTMDYQDISMKTISERISIARSSLYCYYNTKEEIMLDILKDEYTNLINELIIEFETKKEKDVLANNITDIYLNHERLLKIVSVYLTDIEDHSSLDSIINFKAPFVALFDKLFASIKNQFPNTKETDLMIIYNSLIMLTHGLYPMISPHPKQLEAMKAVGMKINDDSKAYSNNYLKFLFKNID